MASAQSNIISSREDVTNKIDELEKEYEGKEIPRPDFWGGFAIEVNYWEFWQGRRNRTHDRFCYKPEAIHGKLKGCPHNETNKSNQKFY